MSNNSIIDDEIIKDVIMQGLQQVDADLTIDDFSAYFDRYNRKLSISFTTTNKSDEKVTIDNVWG